MIPKTIVTKAAPVVPVTDYSCTRALGVTVHHYALGRVNHDNSLEARRVRRNAGWSWAVRVGYVFIWGDT